MRKPIRVAILVGAAGALTLGGTTAALAALGGSQEPQTTTSYSTSSSAAPTASPTAAGKVSPDRARQIALQRVPGARVTETEFDHEHGRAVWEVDL
ncbi:MAG: PepSY domain-containing protein, partial [Micromonosporaceae bacterium]